MRITSCTRLLFAGALLLAGAADSRATCTGSGVTGGFYGYTYIFSPGGNTPASIESAFWALGFGNPAPGVGTDSGAWDDDESTPMAPYGWLVHYDGFDNNYLNAGWGDSSEVDGCVLGRIAPGKSREIMVAAFFDQRPEPYTGFPGYFGVMAVERGPIDLPSFEFTFPGVEQFELVAVPRPIILGSWRGPNGGLEVTLRGPALADVSPGVLTDGSVSAAELVLGYRAYKKTVPVNGPYSRDRRLDSSWERVVEFAPLGQNSTVVLYNACNYTIFAYSLLLESGYETQFVSADSAMVQTHICDPLNDLDGDGFNPSSCCNPSDCNDGDPAIHPGATEVCNGIDDNCDGIVDGIVNGIDSDSDGVQNPCDDCVSAYNPGQSDFDHDGQGDACDLDDGLILVGFGGATEVGWQPESGFVAWNLYRGDLGVLSGTGEYTQAPGSNDLARRDCDLAAPQAPDALNPASGKAAFFLVSGEAVAGEGSLGTDSQGDERANTHPCP